MKYILGRWLITSKFTQWVIILQEFNIKSATPESNKGLALAKFIIDLHIGNIDP